MPSRERQAILQERRRQLIERSFEPKFRREFRRMSKQVQEDYEAGGVERTIIGLEDHTHSLKTLLGQLYMASFNSAQSWLNQQYGKRAGRKLHYKIASIFDDDVELGDASATGRVMQLFRANALKFAKKISETTKNAIKLMIEADVYEGAGEAEIARGIRKELDSISVSRARTIARTETLMAVNEAQYDLIQDMDLPEFVNEWNATLDGRTRKDHKDADGDTAKPGEYFNIGGERMKYPGDRAGGPDQVINCRCVLTQVFLEDDNG